jgi:hypothetical protein
MENILILDDSLSMAVRQGEPTLYEQAIVLVRKLLENRSVKWKGIFASEIVGVSDPLQTTWMDLPAFEQALALHPTPTYRGALAPLVFKIDGLKKSEEALWVLSDLTRINWQTVLQQDLSSTTKKSTAIQLLGIGEPVTQRNIALRNLVLKNEPLFIGEPALLSLGYEVFGEQGLLPTGIRYGITWRDTETQKTLHELPLGQENQSQGQFEEVVALAGRIESVSAALIFPENTMDALPEDDQVWLVPRTLDNPEVLLLAGNPEGQGFLQAALIGFQVNRADPHQPVPASAVNAGAYVLQLSSASPAPEWITFLKARVEAGSGLLVCYDQLPDGIRQQAWTDWWQAWGSSGVIKTVPAGKANFMGGSPPWFFEALDPIVRDPEWAETGFGTYLLSDWQVEWNARIQSFNAQGGEETYEMPLLQTLSFGNGVVAALSVPLSPRENSLILSHSWVPLLSQLVKRVLINPDLFQSSAVVDQTQTNTPEAPTAGWLESDLRPLSSEDQVLLVQAGILFRPTQGIIEEMQTFPRSQTDWTLVALLTCLGLALIELTVSNLL